MLQQPELCRNAQELKSSRPNDPDTEDVVTSLPELQSAMSVEVRARAGRGKPENARML